MTYDEDCRQELEAARRVFRDKLQRLGVQYDKESWQYATGHAEATTWLEMREAEIKERYRQ